MKTQSQSLLERARVASPCSARWEDMEGDDRARFCGQCRKHVFNFSAMTRHDAEAMIRAKEEQVCGRFYQRRDGRVLTADCPAGRDRRRARVKGLCGLLFAAVILSLGSRAALRSQEQPLTSRSPFFQAIEDLVYQARLKLGLIKPPVMGMICIQPAPPPNPSNPPTPQPPQNP